VVLFVGTRLNFIVGFGLPPRFAEDVKILQVDISDEESVAIGLLMSASLATPRWCCNNLRKAAMCFTVAKS
jgi:hypothetical protein